MRRYISKLSRCTHNRLCLKMWSTWAEFNDLHCKARKSCLFTILITISYLHKILSQIKWKKKSKKSNQNNKNKNSTIINSDLFHMLLLFLKWIKNIFLAHWTNEQSCQNIFQSYSGIFIHSSFYTGGTFTLTMYFHDIDQIE